MLLQILFFLWPIRRMGVFKSTMDDLLNLRLRPVDLKNAFPLVLELHFLDFVDNPQPVVPLAPVVTRFSFQTRTISLL